MGNKPGSNKNSAEDAHDFAALPLPEAWFVFDTGVHRLGLQSGLRDRFNNLCFACGFLRKPNGHRSVEQIEVKLIDTFELADGRLESANFFGAIQSRYF
jgi:hypothetical protein